MAAEVDRAGLPGIHLVAVETAWGPGLGCDQVGFDAKVLFQPQFGWLMTVCVAMAVRRPGKSDLQVYDYDIVGQRWPTEPVPYRRYECVFPGWDNTPEWATRPS